MTSNDPKLVAKSARSKDAANRSTGTSAAKTTSETVAYDRTTSGPVTMDEALQRLRPLFEDSPHKVAHWLDDRRRDGDVCLLGGGASMPPNAPSLGIMAHIAPDGRASLYVRLSQGMNPMPPVVGVATTDPAGAFAPALFEKHHQFWMFERAGFEKHFPGKAKNRAGRKPDFTPEELKDEALIYAGVAGALPRTMDGEGGLREKLQDRLGSRCPKHTRFSEIFGPIYKKIDEERSR